MGNDCRQARVGGRLRERGDSIELSECLLHFLLSVFCCAASAFSYLHGEISQNPSSLLARSVLPRVAPPAANLGRGLDYRLQCAHKIFPRHSFDRERESRSSPSSPPSFSPARPSWTGLIIGNNRSSLGAIINSFPGDTNRQTSPVQNPSNNPSILPPPPATLGNVGERDTTTHIRSAAEASPAQTDRHPSAYPSIPDSTPKNSLCCAIQTFRLRYSSSGPLYCALCTVHPAAAPGDRHSDDTGPHLEPPPRFTLQSVSPVGKDP